MSKKQVQLLPARKQGKDASCRACPSRSDCDARLPTLQRRFKKFIASAAVALFALTALFNVHGTVAQTVKWRFEIGTDVQTSAVLGPDGTLYVGSLDYHMSSTQLIQSAAVEELLAL